ncbi:hypothetical protein FJN13_17580 [Alteromonas mediterranea]|uniref:hypothetical protein n=1 Tax=Alteromonas mediterranea TaxID=314275 RepID=UPI0009C0C2E9|nr:hypothetical protein [Alteromonas mediterranea]QDG36516.1 hypothetical protein FJN13_17580 [Alteromonas mediterranea]
MHASRVLLALILPALFSSLVSISALGEGRSVRNIAGQSPSEAALSVLVNEWENTVHESADDDIDDGVPALNSINGIEKYRLLARRIANSNHYVKQRANIIRGPPSNA